MKQQLIISLFFVLGFGFIQTVQSAEIDNNKPTCNLTSMDKTRSYDLKEFDGKVLYVDFWASWCPPCLKSFPFMNKLNSDLKNQGLKVIAVNLDEKPEDAEDFLAKHPAEITIAADPDKECARNFNVKAMPSSYIIDRNGVIRHVHLGFRSGEAQDIRLIIEQLLTDKTAMADSTNEYH